VGNADDYPLTSTQQRAWLNYMRVYHRLEYEMNRQLQNDSGLSLGDYTVMNALSQAPDGRAQLTALATTIGWERSRLSHHLVRMTKRELVDRAPSLHDGRGTDAVLTETGWSVLRAAAPRHAQWVRRAFFSELDERQENALADVLADVHESLLHQGTLPRPGESQS
jgi:DNA-binding MarR family transcriptional regulator